MLLEEARKAPKGGWRLTAAGDHSFSKLWIKFQDGSKDSRWSIDWHGKYSGKRSQALGIRKLIRYAMTDGRHSHEVAIIYDKATNAVLVKLQAGVVVENNTGLTLVTEGFS